MSGVMTQSTILNPSNQIFPQLILKYKPSLFGGKTRAEARRDSS
jgi:hypothetical protein